MRLQQLIYVSEMKLPASLCAAEVSQQIAEIHKTSVRKNVLVSVTGILLVKNGHFLQVLEGRPLVVDRLFDRIKADERHTNIELLASNDIEERMFESWSMGLLNLDTYELLDRDLLVAFGSLITSARLSGDSLHARQTTIRLLRTFSQHLTRQPVEA
jgi:hypothetical protein